MPRVISHVATSSASEAPVNAKTYNEQSSNAQRSLKSSSASDAAAGTGARTVRIVYFSLSSAGKIQGPYAETVTLNGTAAVATLATNIALIERIEVLTAGSGGVPAGDITLYSNSSGGGTAIAVLAAGDVRTYLGHHYVPTGSQARLTDFEVLGGFSTAASFRLMRKTYGSATVEQPITNPTLASNAAAIALTGGDMIPGPARIRALVTPTADAQTSYASFGYEERVVVLGG